MPEEQRRQQDWPAPGWYHDPYDSQGERYWDGLRWDMGDLKHVESNGAIDHSLLPAVIPMQVGADYSSTSKVMTKVLWVLVLLFMIALLFAGTYGLIIAGFIGAIASVVSLIHRQRTARSMSLVPVVTVASIILLTAGIFGSVVSAGSLTPGAANPQANNVVPPEGQIAATPSTDPFGADATVSPNVPTPAAASSSQAPAPQVSQVLPSTDTGDTTVSYSNCNAVRAAGKAPLHQGDPGYASHLDRDHDGVACES